jgi:glucose/mannose transport system substrate-binding protein
VGALDLLEACGNQSSNQGGTGKLTGQLEIFSWWTAGGEADGLAELFKIYNQKYSGVSIKNAAVAGGAGTNAKAVLATRMQGGQPPDSFQVHAGQELISTWVKAGKMEPITSIWNSQHLDAAIPKDLKDIVTSGGDVWSVPVNVHRGNSIFWTAKGYTGSAPATYDDLFTAMDKAKSAGVAAPLALGSKGNWQIAMLFENGVLAEGGSDYYKQLFLGKGSFTDSKVKEALNKMKHLFDYINPDHPTIDWDEASKRLTQGTSTFTIMGDWAKGYFTSLNLTANKDFMGAPSPATKGSYVIVCDTFGLPKGAPHRDNAVAWLQVAGSQEGQAAFNPKKGSIPARTDVSPTLFDPIAQAFITDFKSGKLVPSSAHGSATPEAFASALNDEMGQFVQKRDVNTTANNLQNLAKQFLGS